MVKKPKQPAETAELKKQIESIVGHEIDPGVERIITLFHPAGSYAVFWMDQSAQACWRRLFPVPGKDCSIVRLLEATGVSSTLADGKRLPLRGLTQLNIEMEAKRVQLPTNLRHRPLCATRQSNQPRL
jgi:hypothetical protein